MRVEKFGLRVWQGDVLPMLEPHQHGEIEFNFVVRGGITYLFGGQEFSVRQSEWLVFWGATPHHLMRVNPQTQLIWLTLPLATFLGFDLPATLTKSVLHNKPILETAGVDAALFAQWVEDGQHLDQQHQRILELELEARLRRLALGFKPAPKKRTRSARGFVQLGNAERIAQFISEHHQESLTLANIAKAAGLNANYASSVFKRNFSMTILEYLTQHRIAHAQRLLATTKLGVLQIVFESGFQSSSQFYLAFKRATQVSPLEYRRDKRG